MTTTEFLEQLSRLGVRVWAEGTKTGKRWWGYKNADLRLVPREGYRLHGTPAYTLRFD